MLLAWHNLAELAKESETIGHLNILHIPQDSDGSNVTVLEEASSLSVENGEMPFHLDNKVSHQAMPE